MQNSMPLKVGKEEKSAGSCERSLYLQNIPFIASLPLKNLQLSRMGDSQVSVGQNKRVHLGFFFHRLLRCFSLSTIRLP